MKRTDVGTYLITTAVAALIWWWAASETQVERTVEQSWVDFTVDGPGTWQILPGGQELAVTIQGSQRAVNEGVEMLQRVEVPLPAESGSTNVALADLLSVHPALAGLGLTIVSTEPRTVTVTVEETVDVVARVELGELQAQLLGAPKIDPAEVRLHLPKRLADPERAWVVRAIINPAALRGRTPGVEHVLPVKLSPPPELAAEAGVKIVPDEVKVALTIDTRIRDVKPPLPVRVQVAGSPEDEYDIEVEPKQLRDITVQVSEDLGRKILAGEVTVVAMVYLKSSEKELAITRKPISSFVALMEDGTLQVVTAKGEGPDQPPVVDLRITERAAPGE